MFSKRNCLFPQRLSKPQSTSMKYEHERRPSLTDVLHHMQVEERMGSAVCGVFLLLLLLTPGSWAGDCKGHRQILRGPPGYVTDGPGNYSVNGNCEWLITGECQKEVNRINCFFPFQDCNGSNYHDHYMVEKA